MDKREAISMSVIRRLPRYYRFLCDLLDSGIIRISSKELANRMGLTASQIRQDLNCFGGFGQQGYGYSVKNLKEQISSILGLDSKYKAILIGAGNLGKAVASHMCFNDRGFELIGIFDNNPSLIGTNINNLPVIDIKKLATFCSKYKPVMSILCVPKHVVDKLSGELYSLGIKNYWNFSHYDLSMKYDDVIVENVHLSDSLMTLCYRIKENS